MKRNIYDIFVFISILVLALASCKIRIPEPVKIVELPLLMNFKPDGSSEEWESVNSNRLWADPLGGYPEPSDLEAYMKIAWNSNGLCFLFEISDQYIVTDTVNPWNGDAIEIFLSPYRGSEEIHQLSIVSMPGKDYAGIEIQARDSLSGITVKDVKSVSRTEGNLRTVEVHVGFEHNEGTAINKKDFALQVYVDDTDENKSLKNQLVFYPTGQSYNSSSSMFNVTLTEQGQSLIKGASRLVITDNEKLGLYVFGASEGDKIRLYRNHEFLKTFKSSSLNPYQPDTFDISSFGCDIENDTVFVSISRECLGLNELFLAPRLYEKLSEKRFEKDIRNFVYRDRLVSPPKNATLFIGSSSIVRWETLKKDFPELSVIQRGFGGSTSPEAIMYMDKIALPYEPSEIVYYEGDNDIPMGMSPEEVRENVRIFIEKVAQVLPETKIFILSPKPSINRMHLWEKYKVTHKLLRGLEKEYKNVIYVDVASAMFDQKGRLNHSLFVEDGIHMNADGYAIWTLMLRESMDLEN